MGYRLAGVRDSDDVLVARAGAGDRLAAGELVTRHTDKIYALCWRMLNDRSEAEDATQETFLKLWRFAPRWKKNNARIDTWLYRVATNACLDRLRKRRHQASEQEMLELPDGAPSATQILVDDERKKSVHDALAQLPERQRVAIMLSHFQELSNPDAASVMNVTVEALESLLSRGRRNLKTHLEDQREELMEGVGL